MAVIQLQQREDPSQMLQSFLLQMQNRNEQRRQQEAALKQNQSQFDASLGETRRTNDADIKYKTTMADDVVRKRELATSEGKAKFFVERVIAVTEKNGRPDIGQALTQAFVKQNPDSAPYLAALLQGRPEMPSDVEARGVAEYGAKRATEAAGDTPNAEARNFAFQKSTGEQLSAPAMLDVQQKQPGAADTTTPYGQTLGVLGQRIPSANQVSANETQITTQRMAGESAERQAGIRAEAQGGKVDFNQEKALRDQYLKQVKNYPELKDQIARVNEAANDPSGQSDVGLLFNFMKMLDPSSVVRESEYAQAANTGSLYERAGAMFNKVRNGQRLTDSQRREFVSVANRLYEAVAPRYDTIAEEYRTLAGQYGLDPNRVVQGIGDNGGASSGDIVYGDDGKRVR